MAELKVHSIKERPDEKEPIILLHRVTDWDSENRKFIPTPDVMVSTFNAPYPSTYIVDEFWICWCYAKDQTKFMLSQSVYALTD